MEHHIKDIGLSGQGGLRVEWAGKDMPVLHSIKERFEKEKPLAGVRIAACLHVTTETGNLMYTLKAGGAEVRLCASNPLSTQDDVAATLVENGISVFAIKGEDNKTYYDHINSALDFKPNITMDDGADLVSTIHSDRQDLVKTMFGGTEETTTGVIRLKSLAAKGLLKFPVIAVNDAKTKHFFDNRYGTGQSTIDGILRATNRLMAGSVFVVAGYGWCGKGLARRAGGMGARVVVTEVDHLMALEAVMDGHEVLPMREAAKIGDFFVTVTGCCDVISVENFEQMKDGAIVANSGHFDVEIDVKGLHRIATASRKIRDFVEEYTLPNGKKVYLLAEGRLVNLASAEGHPACVMHMSFANQALAAEYLTKQYKSLEKQVYPVPEDIDMEIAKLKLENIDVNIDILTPEQEKYLNSWDQGT